MLHDVFISYAQDDKAKAAEYYGFLESLGARCWYDALATPGGSVFSQIENALRDSSFMLLLWSQHAAGSEFVQKEVELASTLGRRIIPVKLDNARYTSGVGLILSDLAAVDGRRGVPHEKLKSITSRILPSSLHPAPVFACLNMKGGVGKTTLAANLAGTFHAKLDKSVLLIDLDAQGNLSSLLVDNQKYDEALSRDRSVISCFEHSLASGASSSPSEAMRAIVTTGSPPTAARLAFNLKNPLTAKRLDLIIGQFDLFKYSLMDNFRHLEACRDRFMMFVRAARMQYDVIILDAAPSNSFVTECVVSAATDIISPTTPDKYALRGIQAVSRYMSEGMGLTPGKPIHVLRNAVAKDPDRAENAIIDAYPREMLTARLRDSAFYKIRNPDPHERVRDPLAGLAFSRGDSSIRGALESACRELEERTRDRK
jgi:chromosome partitioning protein